jgi:hypothetical protein
MLSTLRGTKFRDDTIKDKQIISEPEEQGLIRTGNSLLKISVISMHFGSQIYILLQENTEQ